MIQYIAFLRGINVGGRIVKMDMRRSVFEDMGFTDIKTLIASGNVIFSSLMTFIDKTYGKNSTTRNWNTVQKLLA